MQQHTTYDDIEAVRSSYCCERYRSVCALDSLSKCKSERVFEMILSFSIREIENGGEEDATRCVQTICMSCKQDLAQLCGLRVVGLICSVRCKVWKCRVRMVEGAAAVLNCIKNKQHVQSGISAMFKPMCESVHAATLSSSSSTTREAASNLHVMSAAITFLDTTCSRSCVANLLRSNWNSIVRLDRNNEDIVKGSCKLFRKNSLRVEKR